MDSSDSSEGVQRTTITMDVEHLKPEVQERRYGDPGGDTVHELTVEGRASHLVLTRPGEDIPFHSCVPTDYDGEETRFEWGGGAFDNLDEGETEKVQIEVFTVVP